jgi:hypothetical protein
MKCDRKIIDEDHHRHLFIVYGREIEHMLMMAHARFEKSSYETRAYDRPAGLNAASRVLGARSVINHADLLMNFHRNVKNCRHKFSLHRIVDFFTSFSSVSTRAEKLSGDLQLRS